VRLGRPRTTLRWRLTLVYGAVALAVGLLLLALSLVLVDRALSAGFVDIRFLGVTLSDGRTLTFGAFQEQLRAEALDKVLRQGLLALLLLGTLGVLVSYYLAGRVLRPLQSITAAAQRLSVERLDARIALAGPQDELKQLADTFDEMLGRLEAAFEAQRRFVADASHELRTPLAVMRTEVDVALADPDAGVEDLRAAAEVVREATMRADRLVDSLLLLAQSERLAGPAVRERVELPEVAARRCPRWPPRCRSGGWRSRRRTVRPGCWATAGCWSGWPATWWRTPCGTTCRTAGCGWTPARSRAGAGCRCRTPVRCWPRTRWPGCSSRSGGTARRAPPAGGRAGAGHRAGGGRAARGRRHGRRATGRRADRHGRPAAQSLTAVDRSGGEGKMLQDHGD
jgi:HAMP domain-containing protein